MKKRFSMVLITLIVLSPSLHGQENYHFMDGYDWQKFGNAEDAMIIKAFFLKGIAEGSMGTYMNIFETMKYDDTRYRELLNLMKSGIWHIDVSGTTYSRLAEAVEDVYKDYANKRIPVFLIASLASRRLSGQISDQDYFNRLEKLRAFQWK